MQEKKVTKISLSTFLLFLTIIIIILMGIYIYIDKANSSAEISKLNSDTDNMQKTVNALQNKLDSVSSTLNETAETSTTAISSNQNKYMLSDVVGRYSVPAKSVTGEMSEYSLSLYENGTFFYNTDPGFESGYKGYFTINNKEIVLYVLLDCANDIGATLSNNKITLLINEDGSLTDNTKTKSTLKKSNTQYGTADSTDDLVDAIKMRLKNNCLSYDD